MKLLSKDMLGSISFNSLVFIGPFSELGSSVNQYDGKPVLLRGVGNKPGILVVRYVDLIGVPRYDLKSIEYCLGNAARRVYQILLDRGVEKIEFAVIPTEIKYHTKILRKLRSEYSNSRLDFHFEMIKSWLDGRSYKNFPIDSLVYRRPFMDHNTLSRFSFYDYKKRSGLYIIREKSVKDNVLCTVYVGKSDTVLPSRIRSKFYPNPHLYYKEIPGILEYYISVVEIPKKNLLKGKSLKEYEDILVGILRPRDNRMIKGEPNQTIDVGYKPIFEGDGDPFPISLNP